MICKAHNSLIVTPPHEFTVVNKGVNSSYTLFHYTYPAAENVAGWDGFVFTFKTHLI